MISAAAKMLVKLTKTLNSYQMQITADKILWLQVGAEEDSPITLEAAEKAFRKTSEVNYLGSTLSDTGEPDTAINTNLLKGKRSLLRKRPFLRSWSPSMQF